GCWLTHDVLLLWLTAAEQGLARQLPTIARLRHPVSRCRLRRYVRPSTATSRAHAGCQDPPLHAAAPTEGNPACSTTPKDVILAAPPARVPGRALSARPSGAGPSR